MGNVSPSAGNARRVIQFQVIEKRGPAGMNPRVLKKRLESRLGNLHGHLVLGGRDLKGDLGRDQYLAGHVNPDFCLTGPGFTGTSREALVPAGTAVGFISLEACATATAAGCSQPRADVAAGTAVSGVRGEVHAGTIAHCHPFDETYLRWTDSTQCPGGSGTECCCG